MFISHDLRAVYCFYCRVNNVVMVTNNQYHYKIFITQSANDMNIFILLSESPSKVRKIAVYRFLISFLVLQLLRSKDLKNYPKMARKMRGLE